MFEPSHNDLKFMVQKCNYICTYLIERERRKTEDLKNMGKACESLVKASLKERPLSFNKTS